MSNTNQFESFAASAKIFMVTAQIPYRTNCPASIGDKEATHYGIVLRRGGNTPSNNQMMVEYSQGSAHKEAPSVADVLGCLAMDAKSLEFCDTFESWADAFGYDTDSRQAERIYKACRAERNKLLALLGDDLFDQLMSCEEE